MISTLWDEENPGAGVDFFSVMRMRESEGSKGKGKSVKREDKGTIRGCEDNMKAERRLSYTCTRQSRLSDNRGWEAALTTLDQQISQPLRFHLPQCSPPLLEVRLQRLLTRKQTCTQLILCAHSFFSSGALATAHGFRRRGGR